MALALQRSRRNALNEKRRTGVEGLLRKEEFNCILTASRTDSDGCAGDTTAALIYAIVVPGAGCGGLDLTLRSSDSGDMKNSEER